MAEETKINLVPPPQKGKLKHRSPNYPVISLRKGVDRLQTLYDQYKRHWVPIGVAHVKWAFKAQSGIGNQVVAALRAYGLLDVQSDGDERQIKLSERGYHIIDGHSDRPELLRAAALNPVLHAEIWKKYPDGLPPDDVLAHYLKFDRNFNPDAVDGFIARLRETIDYAGLNTSDKVTDTDPSAEDELFEAAEGEEGNGDKMDSPAVAGPPKQQAPPPPAGQKPFPLYLTHNQQGVMHVPATMTTKDYVLLKQQIESHLLIIEATFVRDDPQN